MQTQTAEIMALSASIMAQLRRQRRFPTRLNDEDYNDILSEGVLEALQLLPKYNADRGSMRAFMAHPIARAQLSFAWKTATVGITGDHRGVQVQEYFEDDMLGDCLDPAESPMPKSDDVADEIEAFENIFARHYIKT